MPGLEKSESTKSVEWRLAEGEVDVAKREHGVTIGETNNTGGKRKDRAGLLVCIISLYLLLLCFSFLFFVFQKNVVCISYSLCIFTFDFIYSSYAGRFRDE